MRRTKIICTLGPAVADDIVLSELILNGMNVARINFSHGTHEEHKSRVERLKAVRDKLGCPVALLLDTKGPEIRIGKFAENSVALKKGDSFTIVNEDIIGDNTRCTVTYKDLYKDVVKGSRILIDDGLIELEVENIINKDIQCVVLNGGIISNNKGINVPDSDINLPSLMPQDIEDIKFGVENDFDFIAASLTLGSAVKPK